MGVKRKTRTLTVRMDDDLRRQLDGYAKEEDRAVGAHARLILRRYVDERKANAKGAK